VFFDHFDVLISKIIFKKLKIYIFDDFPSNFFFEKQPQSHSQTHKNIIALNSSFTFITKKKIIQYDGSKLSNILEL